VKKRQIRSNRRRKKVEEQEQEKRKRNYSTTRKTKSSKHKHKDSSNSRCTQFMGNRERKDLVVLGQGHKDINFSLFGGEIANSQKMVSQIQNSMFQKRWCISITQIN
jgi:hypothetical protein